MLAKQLPWSNGNQATPMYYNRATLSCNKPTYSNINRNLPPHHFQPSYYSLGTETCICGFGTNLILHNQGTSNHQNACCISKSSSNTHCDLPVPICDFLKFSFPETLFHRLAVLQRYADSIIYEGKYQRKGVHEVCLLKLLPSGVHVRSVRAALFCPNPISIRFQYQSSLWLLILCSTISKSLICLLEPLLAPFPSLHLPSSLALTSHCLREPAGN